jgi:antitoxin VapB
MKTTVFKNNRTQAVRIPKALQLPEGVKEVEIVKHGDGLLILPKKEKLTWEEFFARTPRVSEDFLADRDDPPPQERDFKWD